MSIIYSYNQRQRHRKLPCRGNGLRGNRRLRAELDIASGSDIAVDEFQRSVCDRDDNCRRDINGCQHIITDLHNHVGLGRRRHVRACRDITMDCNESISDFNVKDICPVCIAVFQQIDQVRCLIDCRAEDHSAIPGSERCTVINLDLCIGCELQQMSFYRLIAQGILENVTCRCTAQIVSVLIVGMKGNGGRCHSSIDRNRIGLYCQIDRREIERSELYCITVNDKVCKHQGAIAALIGPVCSKMIRTGIFVGIVGKGLDLT